MRALTMTVAVVSLTVMTVSAAVAEPLRPLVLGWEQYFRVEAQPASRGGKAVVTGTLWNTASWSTKRIQLLVEALDAGGQVMSQRVAWLGVDLAAGTHASFEVPMPAAASYRVSVFAFDSGHGGRWS